MQPRIRLTTLGGVRVSLITSAENIERETPVELKTRKALALLCYLALNGQPQARPALGGLLWGEDAETKAQNSLRVALANLNGELPGVLDAGRVSVGFAEGAVVEVDAARFEQIAGEARREEPDLDKLEEAAALYQGEFLKGLQIDGAPDFEAWVVVERERLRDLALYVLDALAEALEARRDYTRAVTVLQRLLAIEPWHEQAHRRLMIVYSRQGNFNRALAQYETCKRVLEEELDAPPMPETEDLYERVQAARRVHQSLASQNLPLDTTPFVGRTEELAQILQWLDRSDSRLISIVGLGGMGKTRLAIQAASLANREQALRFLNGVYFVPLAGVAAASSIPASIANALGLALAGRGSYTRGPFAEVAGYLRNKELLLVLDNMEHLIEGAALLGDLLQQAPNVKMIVTSREPLNLTGEWRLDLDGLSFGRGEANLSSDGTENGETVWDAVQFFVQTAQQVQPAFRLTRDLLPAVHRLCRLLAGSPLAIKLATAWLRLMPVEEIIQEVERSLDMLGSSASGGGAPLMRDLPERQRSMRAIFDATYGLLTSAEQATFARLSIFRGGFTREAASKIAGATPPILAGLLDRGLVQNRRNGIGPRYDLHELTRQYAAVKLIEDRFGENAPEAIADAHARYFAGYAAQYAAMAFGSQYRAASYAFAADLENLRAAWQALVAQVRHGGQNGTILESLAQFAPVLVWFYTTKAYYQEGLQAFDALIEAMSEAGWEALEGSSPVAAVSAARRLMVARSKMHHAIFLSHLGRFVEADRELRQALPLLRRMSTGNEGIADVAQALTTLATVTLRRGSPAEAGQYASEGIALYARIGDDLGRADALVTFGLTQTHVGDYVAAQDSLREALAVFERHNYVPGMARCLLNLGTTHSRQYEYDEALPLYERSLAMAEAEGLRAFIMINTSNIGSVHCGKGRHLLSETFYKRSLSMAREMGEQRWIAANLNGMSKNYLDMGDMEAAHSSAREALEVGIEYHAFTDALGSLGFIAHVWARQGRVQDALRLLLFVEHHGATPERDLRFNAPLLADLREELPQLAFADAEAWGAVKTLEEVAAWTLSFSPHTGISESIRSS